MKPGFALGFGDKVFNKNYSQYTYSGIDPECCGDARVYRRDEAHNDLVLTTPQWRQCQFEPLQLRFAKTPFALQANYECDMPDTVTLEDYFREHSSFDFFYGAHRGDNDYAYHPHVYNQKLKEPAKIQRYIRSTLRGNFGPGIPNSIMGFCPVLALAIKLSQANIPEDERVVPLE